MKLSDDFSNNEWRAYADALDGYPNHGGKRDVQFGTCYYCQSAGIEHSYEMFNSLYNREVHAAVQLDDIYRDNIYGPDPKRTAFAHELAEYIYKELGNDY